MNEQKKIMVVDDNSANLTMINGILRNEFKVYPLDSGATALKFLERQKPDLMLLDIEMPGMSGIELFEIIKADKRYTDIPVIFLTGYDAMEFEAMTFKLGASDYVRKPVDDVVLLAKVRLHLELASLRAEKKKGTLREEL